MKMELIHTNRDKKSKILQFGGGNFLRGFVDWIIDVYNEKTGSSIEVIVVKPTEKGDYQNWKDQKGVYHILTKGIKDGALIDEYRKVTCVKSFIHPYKEWNQFIKSAEDDQIKYIVSNTTESGIRFNSSDRIDECPPHEFPAKLTRWLYHRYSYFKGDLQKGCIILPTELLIDNGLRLKETIYQYIDHWSLSDNFKQWIGQTNTFCNTLVDRIVPGIPEHELDSVWQTIGATDYMVTQGEPYHLWAIEAPLHVRIELPLDTIGLNIVFADDISPYRQLKVRILNGAHTTLVPVAYLYGIRTVMDAVEHDVVSNFLHQALYEEVLLTLDFPKSQLTSFANDVIDRFKNPFIEHHLIKIALNSVSKFKTRVLPSVLGYVEKFGSAPQYLIFSWACLIHFYKGEYIGHSIDLNDDPGVISFFQSHWVHYQKGDLSIDQLVFDILAWKKAWDEDLSGNHLIHRALSDKVSLIEEKGVFESLNDLMKS